MNIDQLEQDEARRFAFAQVLYPAAFLVFEVVGLIAIVTESLLAFVLVALWMVGAMMPLTFYSMSRLALVSGRRSAGVFSRDWLWGPWKLALGRAGRRLHERGNLDTRLWTVQVGLYLFALTGIVWLPLALIVIRA